MAHLSKLKSISNRFKNFILATAFVATQLFTPFILSGSASAAAANLDQCANGAIDSPVACGAGWSNQDLNAQQSHYREADSVPFRALLSGLGTSGSHTFTFSWRTTKGGKHAYDYLTTYNRTQAADPCYGVSGCGAASTFPIPADGQVTGAGVTPDAGNFTIFGGSITNVSTYTYPDGTGFSGDKTAQLTITFTASQANPVLAWGGHVASQIDWGLGNSAAAISGAPYHMSTNSLDGDSSGKQDRSIQASAILPTPTMSTQVSDSLVTTGTAVTDTATLTGPDSPLTGTVKFFVCDPSGTATGCATGGTQVGSAVSLTEDIIATKNSGAESSAVSAGFTPVTSGIYCFRAEYTPADAAPYSPQDHTNSTTECFTAEAPKGSITIVKDAVPNSAQDFSFTTSGLSTDQTGFKLDDDNDPTLSNTRTFTNLVASDYGVTESATTGWDFDNVSCTQGANVSKNGAAITIHLTAGENVTCTYKNRERGTITIHKVTDPAGDVTPFSVTASTSDGTIAGSATRNDLATNHDVVYDVSQGSYAVAEAAAAGWSENDSDCASLTVSYNNLNVECTIYNTKLAKLTIVKNTVPSSVDQDFGFTATNLSGNFSLNASSNDTKVFSDLTPGQTYGVTEDGVSGWKLTGLSCTGIDFTWDNISQGVSLNLPAGADVTCTFTNTQLGSITGTKFIVNSDKTLATDQSLADGWEIHLCDSNNSCLTAYTDSSGDYSFNDLLPDTYSIIEVLKDGWTQIFSPSNVDLAAGENSTDNNFGNFENGSISGYKFNDHNGNGTEDQSDEHLAGWTITLKNSQNQVVSQNGLTNPTVTDVNGDYSFTNLAPGTYEVCETGQTGWTQTYPANNACNEVVIDQSGETNTDVNFGNQGRGTITVIKDVVNDDGGKAVASDFTLKVNGSQVTSGATNTYSADNYTVSEVDPTSLGYAQSSIVCVDSNQQSLDATFTLNPGQDVTCTITNDDIAPTLTLIKQVDGGTATKTDWTLSATPNDDQYPTLSAAGGFSKQTAVATTYTLSEDGTPVGYTASNWICDGNGTPISGDQLTIALAEDVSCTITNTRDTGSVRVNKIINPSNDAGTFNLTITGPTNFTAYNQGNGGTTGTRTVDTGTYSVEETAYIGTDLSDYSSSYACYNGNSLVASGDATASSDFAVGKGDSVVCTFTNTHYSSISGTKYEANSDGSTVKTLADWTICIDANDNGLCDSGEDSTVTGADGSFSFTKLLPGVYHLIESLKSGWTQIFSPSSVDLSAGQDSTANDFGNFENASIKGYKWSDLNGDGHKQSGEPKLSGWTITLYDAQDAVVGTDVTNGSGYYEFTNVVPGTYKVCETAQNGWVQTHPATADGCYHFDVSLSGHTYHKNFGNQGRGTITVNKVVVNDNGGPAVPSDFTLNVNGSQVSSGVTNDYNAFNDYTVDENDPTSQGYQQTDFTCYNDNEDSLGATFTLNPGENVVCTITNDDIAPQLKVYKFVNNQDTNLTKTSADFTMNVDGTNVSDPSFPGSEQGTTVTLNAGDYNVTEDTDSNYTADFAGDCTGSIKVGETKYCYVENTAVRNPAIHVEKDGPASAYAGNTVTYTFTVTNPGNVPLSGLTVSDDVAGDGATLQSGDVSNTGWLDPGETWIYTVQYKIPTSQKGDVVNTVTACGEPNFIVRLTEGEFDGSTDKVCDTDTHTTRILHVLGASTVLPNTGQGPLLNFVAGGMLILLALGARWFGRKSQTATL